MDNLCLSCAVCNSVKGEKSLKDNTEELKEFKDRMKHRKVTEERWAKIQLDFVEKLHNEGKHDFPKIRDTAMVALRESRIDEMNFDDRQGLRYVDKDHSSSATCDKRIIHHRDHAI
jgi:hypothetical protein